MIFSICLVAGNWADTEYLPNVEEFRAYCNPITDISPLIHCKKLHQSYFFDCPITDIR